MGLYYLDVQTSIQTASIIITMLSIVIGVGMGIVQFRNLVKTRRIQLYTELFNKLTEKEVQRDFTEVLMIWKWKDPDEFFEKYGPEKNPDEFLKFSSSISYLENVGLFVKENLVEKLLSSFSFLPSILTYPFNSCRMDIGCLVLVRQPF